MDGFIGEIRAFPYRYCPQDWLPCMGQTVNISQYQVLFSIIGVTYGGDGRISFNLPNMQGFAAMGRGQGPGLTNRPWGQHVGSETATIDTVSQLPSHNHLVELAFSPVPTPMTAAPASVAPLSYLSHPVKPRATGGNIACADFSNNSTNNATLAATAIGAYPASPMPTPHSNLQPYLPLQLCICWQGVYPTRP